MPRPPKKKTRVLAEAYTTGKLKAEAKFNKKKFDLKNFPTLLKEKFFESLEQIDPIETVALLGLTTIYQPIIEISVPLISDTLLSLNWNFGFFTPDWIGLFTKLAGEATPDLPQTPSKMPTREEILENMEKHPENWTPVYDYSLPQQYDENKKPIPRPIAGWKRTIPFNDEQIPDPEKEVSANEMQGLKVWKFQSWVLAFICAFITVRYGAEIISSLGGVAKLAGALIAL